MEFTNLPQRLFYINYHWAQYKTGLVTSHIWLESLWTNLNMESKGVLQKSINSEGVVLES